MILARDPVLMIQYGAMTKSPRILFAAAGVLALAWSAGIPADAAAAAKDAKEIEAAKTAEAPETIAVAPARAEGEGPYSRLILRGATVIDGTGAPPAGPADIVIDGNRITSIKFVGAPGVAIDPKGRLEAKPGDRELDLTGMFVLPGFVDLHGHIGGVEQGTPAEYVFKLWLGHGITTIRDPGSGNGLAFVREHQRRSAKNEITAPRIHPYVFFGQDREEPFTTAEQARAWVREMGKQGAEGFKFFGYRPDIMKAAIEEAKKLGLRTTCHHAQLNVARVNALDSARWGLSSMEHWYGLPEALFDGRTVQNYPAGYNYLNEQDRFGEAGRLWRQAAAPGSERWRAVIDELVALDFTLDPTLNIYEASRDLMRAYRAEWHDQYTLPALWQFYQPSRIAHGSYWYSWSTAHEVDWRENYRLWMRFLNDYKNAGGRVTVGTDSGYIFQLYGFAFVREMELLQEAGFHPLEAIRAATLHGAEALGVADQVGSVEPGKLADLVVVGADPVANLKVLYGTGTLALDQNNQPVRLGGVRWTIKDGIVYDAPKLLADVRAMVAKAKDGKELPLPGTAPPSTPASPPTP